MQSNGTPMLRSRMSLPVAVALAIALLPTLSCGGSPATATDTSASASVAPPPPAAETQVAAARETQVAAAPAAKPTGQKKGRVVILGFDGVEPTIVDTMLAAGELPNLAKLRDNGSYHRLTSAIPPQSPSAWSSFTTCTSTGNHGVYDFVMRDPAKHQPRVGFGSTKHAELNPDGTVKTPVRFTGIRKGESFWKEADSQGFVCKALNVPFAFPADDMAQGCMLCGLGVTDIRATDSTFFSFSDGYDKQESVPGGMLFPLQFDGDVAKTSIPGARDSRVTSFSDPKAFVRADLEFTLDRPNKSVAVKTPSDTVTVKEGEWSEWVEWSFEVSPSYTVRAISRFYGMTIGERVNIYMACLQYHPKAPYMRFSTPESYAGELADRYGLFKTIGWSYDTKALSRDALSEDAFLEDVRNTMAFYERLTLDELTREDSDMVIAAWTGPDRVSHMFWRFRDPKHPLYTEEGAKKYGRAVEDTYVKMDQIVGNVMSKLGPDDLLMILSDHGFKSFRKGLNVNTWLVRNGYLTLKGQTDAATAFTTKEQNFMSGFDWSKTKAYSIGLGSIFLNLKDREGMGIVEPEDADALAAEIREKLLALTDPDTGEKVFDAIYTRDVFKGDSAENAPDLQLGYADGYQSSKATVSGSAPEPIFDINDDKWSGEHASSDVAKTPGIFFSNKKINTEQPAIVDLGVTALTYLGGRVPERYEGKPLL